MPTSETALAVTLTVADLRQVVCEAVKASLPPPGNGDEELLTVQELAPRLKMKPSSIYALVRQNRIPCIKVGKRLRFRSGVVVAFLEKKH